MLFLKQHDRRHHHGRFGRCGYAEDFISGALGTKEAVAIVPRVAKKIAQAKKAGKTVVFTRDTHHENYLQTQEGKNLPVPHCIENTPGWEIGSCVGHHRRADF